QQPLHVRPEPAELDGEDEPRRSRVAPASEHMSLRQAIAAAVDLDRVEARRIVREPSRGREVGRIESALPARVHEARRPDAERIDRWGGSQRTRWRPIGWHE